MAKALYRIYRPKTLDEVLGHETNITILKNAAKQDKLGHAYLFYGSRGTGKTTTARLIAKVLNCKKRTDDEKFISKGEPCTKCVQCMATDTGTSLDVIEIDAASNRGIDEIRNLKESVRVAPTQGAYKVYIIDEVHMLTGPAFNALLKILEEPPSYIVFILATTEYEKLPATITSRTQRFLFKKIAKIKILEKLATIVKAEKIKISPYALELIASAGEGSLRDAESLLDQVSTTQGEITLDTVERLVGRAGIKKIEEFSSSVLDGNLKESIAYLNEVQTEGHNITQFTKDLIHYLRKVLSLSLNPDLEKTFHLELTNDEIDHLKSLSENVDQEALVTLIRSFIRAYSEIRYSPFAIIPLELALIETLGK